MIKRVVLASCLILLMILAAVFVWKAAPRNEPVYEGKPLSRWLEGHLPYTSANPPLNSPGWKKADEALRRTGTNAIPTLLQMIRAKDPPKPVLKLLDWVSKQRLVVIRYRYAFHRNDEAEYAFRVLGTNAACAVPALIKIYQTMCLQILKGAPLWHWAILVRLRLLRFLFCWQGLFIPTLTYGFMPSLP